jgi:threonine dehydratase
VVEGASPDSSPSGEHALDVTDVQAAGRILNGVVRTTPVIRSRALSELVGGAAYLKCENLQRTGSFKIRGAYVRMSRLTAEERARGVVAASAGNHAQGVALAAGLLGLQATVFMPEGAPLPKVQATRAYGAEVRFAGGTVDEALLAARAESDRTGAIFIHPFDHRDVLAGQGTVGLEILEQCPGVRTVLVCTGGGGLAAGVAVAVRALRPDVRIVAVQAAGAAAYPGSLAAGVPVALGSMSTMADGIAVARPSRLAFGILQQEQVEVATVSEEGLSQALLLCLERAKMVVEPAGVAAVAALLEDPTAYEPPVVAVVSGGNVDPLLLLRVLRHGLAAAGRYLDVRVRIPDRPGALVALLGEIAGANANVDEIEHVRTTATLQPDEAEVALRLETRGAEHCAELVSRLRSAGYQLDV